MIAYFDTSAIVPLLIAEPGSERALRSYSAAGRVVTSRLMYAEAHAALASAQRLRRLTRRELRERVVELQRLDDSIYVVEVTKGLSRLAGDLAEQFGLRGFDAVHLACAQAVVAATERATLLVVAGDRALLAAAHKLGFPTVSTSD